MIKFVVLQPINSSITFEKSGITTIHPKKYFSSEGLLVTQMARTANIAIIPGDGIGKEVVTQGVRILDYLSDQFSLEFDCSFIDGGAQYYLNKGKEWEDGAFEQCKKADAIFLGAVGWPKASLPDGNIAGAGIVFGLRFGLDLYANVRPTKLYAGVKHKIHGQFRRVWESVDMVTVRENTEGLYTPIRGSLNRYMNEELAIDTMVTTEKGARRIIDFAFKLALQRKGAPGDGVSRVTCVDKSNVLQGSRLFRSIFDEIATGYPSVERDYAYIDAYLQWLIRNPERYDVTVSENLMGDISSDLAAVLGGSLGMAASANIGDNHGLFEPVHGSAPKHAGRNISNPIGAISSLKMMCEYLHTKEHGEDYKRAADAIDFAIERTIRQNTHLTYDLGGSASTQECTDAIIKNIILVE
ncbi:MAG: isocitrate/isopropylmalate dehydrogenase family protein [Candidatus Heimdallarchaeota archaeon]|nr:isocitrate/isopropylmalate dehydrogenase family protein [Candidatus Heimdallarchaeota archaeon]